jgi:hypothetical protein
MIVLEKNTIIPLSQLYAKAMGEEKPEEELMGKRKPSPRLSTT